MSVAAHQGRGRNRPQLLLIEMAPAHDNENDALREQVRLLSAGMGLRYEDLTAVVPPGALELAASGERMKAIRLLRKATGARLVEAKRMVDAVRRDGG